MTHRFVFEFQNIVQGPTSAQLLLALRQEPLIWETLINTPFGDQALSQYLSRQNALSPQEGDLTLAVSQADFWSPAGLALLALGDPIPLSNLRDADFSMLEPELHQKAKLAYQTWTNGFSQDLPSTDVALQVSDLQNAGLVALSLREQWLFHGNWDFIDPRISTHQNSLKAIAACLLGFLPEAVDFIQHLYQVDSGLGLHVLLSNPIPDEERARILCSVVQSMPRDHVYNAISEIHTRRPDLVRAIAGCLDDFLTLPSPLLPAELLPGQRPTFGHYVSGLCATYQKANILAQVKEDVLSIIPLYLDTQRMTQKLEAFLHAEVALTLSRVEEPSSSMDEHISAALQAWEQAIQIDPQEDAYRCRYAAMLAKLDRITEAQAMISSEETSATDLHTSQTHNPLIDYTQAIISFRQWNTELVLEVLQKLARADLSTLTPPEKLELAQIALELEDPASTQIFAEHILIQQPEYAQALALHTRANLELGNDELALVTASLAQVFKPQVTHQRLLVDALIANKAYPDAYKECEEIVADAEVALASDWRTLANCAVLAGYKDEALNAFQKALEIDPQDGLTLEIMGHLALSENDHDTALVYYQEATQLSPDQISPWLSLARLHQTAGRGHDFLHTLSLASQAIPNSPEILFYLGEAYRQNHLLAEAVTPLRLSANLLFTSQYSFKSTRRLIDLGRKITNSLGYTFYRLGYIDEARMVYERILAADNQLFEQSPSITYGYAKTLVALGLTDQSLPWFAFVNQHDHKNQQVVLDYAHALLDSYNQEKNTQHLSLAITYLRNLSQSQAVQSDVAQIPPDLAQSWVWGQADLEDQASFFAEVQALLAESLYKAGELSESMQAYLKALDSSLIHQPAWRYRLSFGLGKIAVEMDQPDTAVAALLEAQQLNPREPELHCALSSAYLSLKLPSDAYHSAVDAIRISQDDPQMLVWFSDQCLKIAEIQDEQAGQAEVTLNKAVPAKKAAQKALERAINIDPEQGDLRVRLAKVQLLLGDPLSAQKSLIVLLDDQSQEGSVTPPTPTIPELTEKSEGIHAGLDPDRQPIKVNLGELRQSANLLCAMNQPEIAARFLEQAIRQTPHEVPVDSHLVQAELYQQLSQTRQLSGDLVNSLRAIEQAILINPQYPPYYLQEANLLLDLNRLEDAKSSLEKITALDPNHPSIHLELALVAFGQGNLQEALKYAHQALDAYTQHGDTPRSQFTRWFCAELYHALLLDERALEYLDEGSDQSLFLENCLLAAEINLQNEDLERTTQSLAPVIEHCEYHPRLLAIQARLIARQEGASEIALNLLHQAAERSTSLVSPSFQPPGDESSEKIDDDAPSIDLPSKLFSVLTLGWRGNEDDLASQSASVQVGPEAEADFYQEQVHRLAQIAQQRSLACAADELNQWRLVDQFSTSHCLLAPDLPIAHLQRIQFLVRRAEKEHLYRTLQVVKHAPGEHSLSHQLPGEIANHLLRAEACMDLESPFAQIQINRWRVRSEIALHSTHPEHDLSRDLEFPAAMVPDLEDIGSKLSLMLLLGEIEKAHHFASPFILQPLIAIIFATSLSEADPDSAIHLCENAINRLTNTDLSLPEPLPLLHFSIAKAAFTLAKQAESNLSGQKSHLDLALKSIQAALELWPDEPSWHIFAGDLMRYDHEICQTDVFQDQVFQDQEGASSEPAEIFLNTELLATAIHHYQAAVNLEPENGEHYLRLGHLMDQLGETEQALQAYIDSTKVSPDLAEAWLEQSRIQKNMGDIEKAIYCAERALEIRSQSTDALLLRSELALMANNPRGALSRAQTILKENPDHVQAWYVLALAMEALHQPAEALSALEKAIQYHREIYPGNGHHHSPDEQQFAGDQNQAYSSDATYQNKFAPLRVRLIYALDGPQKAIQNLQIYLSNYPDDPHLNAMLADYSIQVGDHVSALQAAHLALQNYRVSPEPLSTLEQARLHFQIGVICRQSGQLDQAIFHLNHAITKYLEENALTQNIEASLELGRAYQDRRQVQQALDVYQSAARICPNDYRAYYMAGLALREAKDYHEAELMLRQAAHLAPNEVVIHRQLAAVVALNLVHNRRLVTPE